MIRSIMQREPSSEPTEGRQEIQLACFRVGSETYGLDIFRIKEIIRLLKFTPVPKAPSFVEGAINLRGTVIPVVDLRKRFDQKPTGDERKVRIIICSLAGRIVGLIVDEVYEVRRFTRREIQPSPHFLKGRGTEFFPGVCRRGDDLLMILDLEKILATEEKIDLETFKK